MHILQVVPQMTVGGVERGVIDLARGLIRRGHRVSVVSAGGPLVERLVAQGAMHYTLPVDKKTPVGIFSCIPALARMIQETGVDVVHARSRVPGWIGWAAARRTQRAFVTTAHGFYAPHAASRVMAWGRLVIAPSEALGRHMVDRFGVPRARLRVIPRGVDLEEFRFQPPLASHAGPWRIGLFGRLSPIKGHEVALEACSRLIRGGMPVTLCLAGGMPDSPYQRRLEALIRDLTLDQAVEWLGVRQDVAGLIASCDLVLMPSVYPESFGRGVLEAQAVGRPVIASRIGALAELIEDGRTGLLVPPADPSALADAVARFVRDGSLRARCVEAARRKVEADGTVDRMVERTLAVYEECLTAPRILIWKLRALGDVVLATPSLRAIRKRFPAGHVTLIVDRSAYDLIATCPYLDDIMPYDPAGKDSGVRGHMALLARLRCRGFDLSIDLQNSRLTHALAWAAGIPVRAGYQRRCGALLNRAVPLPRGSFAPVAHQHYLLQRVGCPPDGDALELWPSASDAERAERLLAAAPGGPGPLVGIHPGGSGRWRTKRWDLARWAQLCDRLAERRVRVIVTGGPDERALGDALVRLTSSKPWLVVGQTRLMELACVIKRCDLFTTHDSAPLHLAAAVGTPTVALFGPTDPARHLPPRFKGAALVHDVFCRPCYAPRCRTITHACMKGIAVERVLGAALALLPQQRAAEVSG